MDPGVVVRQTRADEAELVLALRLDFVAEHRGLIRDELGADLVAATRSYVSVHHAADRLVSWVAEDGAGALGVVSLLRSDLPPLPEDLRTEQGHVLNLWVAPGRRGEGLGRALFDACLRGAAALGQRSVSLFATDAGRPLYLGSGFEGDQRWMQLPLPSEGRVPRP